MDNHVNQANQPRNQANLDTKVVAIVLNLDINILVVTGKHCAVIFGNVA